MIHPRSCPSFLLIGGVLAALGVVTTAHADGSGEVIRVAAHCDVFGPGYVDVGNGYCGRVVIGGQSGSTGHVRIDQPSHAGTNSWSQPAGTSNAALRSDTTGMLPGISDAQHLRIGSGADPFAR